MLKRIFKRCFKFAVYSWDVEFCVMLRKNRFGKHVVKAGLLVIPVALAYYAIISEPSSPHQFSQSDCFNCHFTIPAEDEPRPYRFVSSISGLCTGCHNDLNPVSHYVNGEAYETYEPVFPVLEIDRITCATCHDPHMPSVDPATGEKTYFLRDGVTGKAECLLCHTSDMPSAGIFTHLPAMDRAHGVANFTVLVRETLDYSDRRLFGVLDTLVSLDDLSVYCLNCHDDPINPELTSPGSEAYMHGPDNGMSHPVGIDHEAAAMNNRELRLADRDPRILLFDGKIGCCSCHDPYAPGVSIGLRVGSTVDYTALCLGCHIL